jgi:hypothetical protein
MRMWDIDPSRLCRQHLLGEHCELHMMVGTLNKGTRMEGYYAKGLVNTDLLVPRHEALVAEMTARGMKHKSPLPAFVNPHRGFVVGSPVDRCGECR